MAEVKINTRLPTFFVVGAQKAGTTSLHDWLSQQPDVCLPTGKETHFYSSDEKYQRGMEWYLAQFPKCTEDSVMGEVGPEYMYSMSAPDRIREWIAAPRLIFVFRHPIERAFSNYLMERRTGHEQLSFPAALAAEPQRLARDDDYARAHFSYMSRGCYAEQVEHYRRVFPHAGFLFLKFDDLIDEGSKGTETYQSVCRFIGVNSSPEVADRSKKGNPVSVARSTLLRDLLHGSSKLKRTIGALFPDKDLKERFAARLDNLNRRPVARPSMGMIPDAVIVKTREETLRLQAITHLDLSDWQARTDSLARAGVAEKLGHTQ